MIFEIKMAVASSNVDGVDDVIYIHECSICLEYFNDPKLLPCNHSFCCVCLEKLVEKEKQRLKTAEEPEEATEFDCPLCLTKFTLKPEEKIADLPNDDFLRKIQQVVRPEQEENGPNCSLCNQRAITMCEECRKVLCKHCHIEHNTEFQEHELQPLSAILERERMEKIGTHNMRCVLHNRVPPDFYCKTCEELICVRCISSKAKINVHAKPDHICVGIHEVDYKLREALKLDNEVMEENLTQGKHALKTAEYSRKYNKETADRLQLQVRTKTERVLKDFTEILNQKSQELISAIEEEFNPVVDNLCSQSDSLSKYVKRAERYLEETKSLLEKGNIAEILSSQEEIAENRKILDEGRPKNEPRIIEEFYESMIVEEIDASDILRELLTIEKLCKNSAIMRDERELVKALIGLVDKNFTWTLCYRASRDNWKGQDFHNLCDTKSPTVILVKVGVNIFGGYADQNWQGQHVPKSSEECFLFSLKNEHKLAPFKCPLVEGRNDSAIYCNPECGAIFGLWGPDLLISDDAIANELSCSNLGRVYQPPPGYEFGTPKTQSLLAGSYNFSPCEIEVFCLD